MTVRPPAPLQSQTLNSSQAANTACSPGQPESGGLHLGLRAKFTLALGVCTAIVLLLAVFTSWRAMESMQENLGSAFARNLTRYNKQRILAPVMRELALSQQLANSEVTRRWLLDEGDPAKKALFFAEVEHYRRAFEDHSYFLISGTTRNYYFNDPRSAPSTRPRYALKPGNPNDAWFFNTMRNTRDFNINVDPDIRLKVTKVWFNVMVRDHNRNLGLAGTGMDLTRFLNLFITNSEAGVTPIIVNRAGAIQAHPDRSLIDYSSINDKGAAHSTIYDLLTNAPDRTAMRNALQRAQRDSDSIQMFRAELNGRQELFAVSFIPELNWHVVTAVNLKAAQVMDVRLWLFLLGSEGVLLALLMVAIVVGVNRIFLSPLLALTRSVRTMAVGNYAVELPPASGDELGELTRAFGAMAAQVRTHTDQLETRVRERTRELMTVNEQMTAANKQIGDSIQYASLIQNAILPDRELARTLADRYFVLWRPRDVVGGDFYVFRADADGCLLGVVDCAGHGVPGAFMTMLAHAAVNVALDTQGLSDPARLLGDVDARIRAMMHGDPTTAQITTQMDAGFAYVDFKAGTVTFAGAKTSLYRCDGECVHETKGDRRAIGGKRTPEFANQSTPLDGRTTFYLTTDGLLDQSGGPKGYSFGHARFAALLQHHAALPLTDQRDAFARELEAYQGELAQRDDITVLSFRFAPAEPPAP